jgi:hypothetical protein
MDAAFKTAAYPAYTTAELQATIAAGRGNPSMEAEVARRILVEAGVTSAMTDGERLRFVNTGSAR